MLWVGISTSSANMNAINLLLIIFKIMLFKLLIIIYKNDKQFDSGFDSRII